MRKLLPLLLIFLFAAACSDETEPVTTGDRAEAAGVVVTATEYAFIPETLSIAAPSSVELRNTGGLEHTWTVLASPIDQETGLGGTEVLAEARAQVGQSAVADISALPAGTYQVVCAIAGHFSAGMKGELVIADG